MEVTELLRRNTRLFLNCLSDLPADRASTRAGENTNTIEFLALHLVDVRFFLAKYLGLVLDHPYAARLEEAEGIEDIEDFPPTTEMVWHWQEVSQRIGDRLEGMTGEDFDRKSEQQFPLSGHSVRSGILFLLQHEMYHIGQLALLRKHAGLPAMKWS